MKKSKKHILVVDDEITIRTLLVNIIGQEYEVTAKENGLQALNWIQVGNIPDLIIADIKMPELDGYQLVKNIRSSGLYSDIPLLMLSGSEDSKTRISFYKLRVRNFIVKPFNPEELMVLVKLILDDLNELDETQT
ncbi:MAG: response regulator [Bacteroidales bacterium]|nr:response regulator [Bacteroidales bacterium]MCF8326940.1 response regulator [Bacteroidales bacterium]